MCVWNPSSNTCSPYEKIVRSCQSNGNNKSDSDDDDDDDDDDDGDKKKDSDDDLSKKRYYSTGAVIKGLGNYPDLENCINLSRTEKRVDNRSNLFFWIFIIILIVAIIVLAYLISKLNQKE
jgi:hypothetical protein